MDRNCCLCNTPIYECMGAVLARDLEMWRLKERTTVRELCGKCAMRQSMKGFCDIPFTDREKEVFGIED